MRKEIFKKAAKILTDVKLDLEGDKKMFFEVKGSTDKYSVIMEYNGFNVLEHSCSCRYMATSDPKNLCSHKVSVIALNVIEELKKLGWTIEEPKKENDKEIPKEE